MKVLALPLRLLFVGVYVAGAVVFNYFLGVIDYGGLPSSAGMWAAILAGGLAAGMLALWVEVLIGRRWRLWPANLLAFMLRAIVMASAWLSLAYTISSLFMLLQEVPLPGAAPVSTVLYIEVAPVLFTYMVAPAGPIGSFVGMLTGLLLLHGIRRSGIGTSAQVGDPEVRSAARS